MRAAALAGPTSAVLNAPVALSTAGRSRGSQTCLGREARRRQRHCLAGPEVYSSFAVPCYRVLHLPTSRLEHSKRAPGASRSAEAVPAEEDDETCELVSGSEVRIGEGKEHFAAYQVTAVKNGNGAGVLLLTDILGIHDEETREFASRLACFGYTVLVPDLFRGNPWEGRKKEPKGPEYEAWRTQVCNRDRVLDDVAVATEYLAQQMSEGRDPGQGRIGLLGFCFGGGRAIEYLADDEDKQFTAAVVFYGTRFDPKLGADVRSPLLFISGDADSLVPSSQVKEFERALKKSVLRSQHRVKVYKGRGHAFAHHPDMEDDEDAEDAFETMRHWFHEHLLPGLHSS